MSFLIASEYWKNSLRRSQLSRFFFARPYHSWERGANENTNGLIRQYIPKGSDFTNITQEFLEEVERKLNERPRKRHGFLLPNQVFSKLTGLDARVFV